MAGSVPVDDIQIEIEASSSDAVKKVNDLIGAINRLSQAGSGVESVSQRIRDIGSAAGQSDSAEKVQQRREALNRATRQASPSVSETETSVGPDIEQKISILGLLKSAIQAASSAAGNLKERLKGAIEGASSAASSLKEKLKDLPNPVRSLLSVLEKVGRAGLTGLKSLGKSVVDNITSPFKEAVKAVKTWKDAIGRIAFYRAVRGAIKFITDGFKEGIDNLYQYSRIVGTEFSPAMDSLATDLMYARNSLGAMVAPIIQALAPAVEYLTQKFVELTTAIGKAFAALTGKSTFSKAVRFPKEYAKSANEAGKAAHDAAQAAKDFSLGIDELNVISESSGGKSGGISGDALDYGSMFEEVQVPTDMLDWAKEIREAIENGDWRRVGEILAEKLNEVVEGWDAYGWGEKLGKAITNGLNVIYGFMSTFDFEQLGAKIAQGLNGLVENIDWELLGRLFALKFKALFDFLYGFVSNLNWMAIVEAIESVFVGFFKELGFDTTNLEKSFANLNAALSPLIELISGGLKWAYENVLVPLSTWTIETAVPTVIDTLSSAIAFFTSVVEALEPLGIWLWDNFLKPLGEWAGDVFIGALNTINGLLDDLTSLLRGDTSFTEFLDNLDLGETLLLAFATAFGLVTAATTLWNTIGAVATVVTTGLGAAIAFLTSPIGIAVLAIAGLITAGVLLYQNWETVKEVLLGVWDGIVNGIKDAVNLIIGFFEGMANAVANGLNFVIGGMNSLSFEVPDWVPGIGGNKFGFNIPTIQPVIIPRLATGGILDSGQMFIAREAGPELVGNIGQKTAVVNNEQIIQGITNGVENANEEQNALLREQNELLRALLNKDTSVRIGNKEIKRAYDTANRQSGAAIMAGGVLA